MEELEATSEQIDEWTGADMDAKPVDEVPRLVVLLGLTEGATVDDLEASLRASRPALVGRVPAGAQLRLGVRHPEDPMAAAMGARGTLASLDGVVELTWPESSPLATLVEAAGGLRGALTDPVDPSRCAVVAGRCRRFRSAEGPVMLALAGRRAPGTTMDELSTWWTERHGPLVLQLLGPLALCYEQLHGDEDIAGRAATAIGVAGTRYDMFDTGFFAGMQDFAAPFLRDPEVAAKMYKDELRHVDHDSLRGAMQRPV